jgi:TPR repeat protein
MQRPHTPLWRTIARLATISIVTGIPLSMSAQTRDEVPRLTKACETGTLTACERLGVMYRFGEHVTQDSARAVTLLTRACDGGVPVA